MTPVRIVHDDGSATISAADRGLLYGDGLFETLACRNGQPRFLSAHMDRLSAGCARLGMPEPPRQQLESAIRLTAGRAVAGGRPAARALVKLILTRGASSERGYAPPAVVSPCCIIQAFPWPADTAQHGERGVAVQYSRVPLTENPLLAGIKHLHRLDSVLARAALAGSDCAEALLCAWGLSVLQPKRCTSFNWDKSPGQESLHEMARASAEQWIAIFAGRVPPRLVNPEAWPRYRERFRQYMGVLPDPLP